MRARARAPQGGAPRRANATRAIAACRRLLELLLLPGPDSKMQIQQHLLGARSVSPADISDCPSAGPDIDLVLEGLDGQQMVDMTRLPPRNSETSGGLSAESALRSKRLSEFDAERHVKLRWRPKFTGVVLCVVLLTGTCGTFDSPVLAVLPLLAVMILLTWHVLQGGLHCCNLEGNPRTIQSRMVESVKTGDADYYNVHADDTEFPPKTFTLIYRGDWHLYVIVLGYSALATMILATTIAGDGGIIFTGDYRAALFCSAFGTITFALLTLSVIGTWIPTPTCCNILYIRESRLRDESPHAASLRDAMLKTLARYGVDRRSHEKDFGPTHMFFVVIMPAIAAIGFPFLEVWETACGNPFASTATNMTGRAATVTIGVCNHENMDILHDAHLWILVGLSTTATFCAWFGATNMIRMEWHRTVLELTLRMRYLTELLQSGTAFAHVKTLTLPSIVDAAPNADSGSQICDGQLKSNDGADPCVASQTDLWRQSYVTWQDARAFIQRYDVNFVLSSGNPPMSVLVLVAVASTSTVVIHVWVGAAKSPLALLTPFSFMLTFVSIWSSIVSFGLVLCVFELYSETPRQLLLLNQHRFSLASRSSTHANVATSTAGKEINELDVVIARLITHIEQSDIPPKFIGIEVKPTLVRAMKGYFVGAVGALLVRVVANAFGES